MTGGRRLLGGVVVLLVVAALALWAASRFTWLTVDWDTPLRGRVATTASGADTEPVLVPWALLSLAAVAGVLATSGWGRRAVGTLVALAGAWALLRAVTGFAAPPADAVPATTRTAGRVAGVAAHPVGPAVAALGALLLLGAGAVTALRAGTLPRLGRRYDAPGSPGPGSAAGGSVAPTLEGEPATATAADHDMWKALDAGEDPTTGPAIEPDTEPDTGSSTGPAAGPDGAGQPDVSTRSVGRDGAA